MPTLGEIYEDSQALIINDSAWDVDAVVAVYNQGIRKISGMVLLPALETITTIATGVTNSVSIPYFHQNLRFCSSLTNNRKINIYGSPTLLLRQFPVIDQTGPVIGVTVKNKSLMYQRIPSTSETLHIHYWKTPSEYFESDEPDCIPEHLQEDLLVNFAAWKIFTAIEDWTDGQKINALHHKKEFEAAMEELVKFIGPNNNEPIDFKDEAILDIYAGDINI
jgi:hypothetical protein